MKNTLKKYFVKAIKLNFALLGLSFLLSAFASEIPAQGTLFSYQDNLPKHITPATGTFEFEIRLFDASAGGTQIGATNLISAVEVKNSAFTVWLDFGAAAFSGADRFIEVSVRRSGSSGAFTTLAPRARILSVPYAIRALNATTADNALNLNGVNVNDFVLATDTRLSDSRNPNPGSGNYIQNTTSQQASANFNISGNGTLGGTLSGNIVNAQTQYNLVGSRILSAPGTNNTFTGINAGAANTSGQGNAFFGTNAGALNSTGNFNAIFGSFAGITNSTGIRNAFFGTNSGRANTNGSDNSFFGTNTGFNNTTGLGNAFFGSLAGVGNTTGNGNSFFGINAGFNNSTASGNSFFGANSGSSNTGGSNNVFVGFNSGNANTTGSSNSFVGRGAGTANSTGNGNSFFGDSAGVAGTTAFFNVFLGAQAGSITTTGGNNTFVGTFAGNSNTTGNNNTIVGNNADVGSGNLTFATAIGAGATVSTSNTVVLGRAADTVIVPGSFDGGNIKSGTIPESRLGVAGMGFMGRASFSGAGTQLFAPNGISNQTSVSADVEMLTPNRDCTAQNLSVNTSGALTLFNPWVFTLRVNDSDTPVSCTVSGSTSCNSGTATFAVPAGSRVVIKSNRGENTTLNFQFGWECR